MQLLLNTNISQRPERDRDYINGHYDTMMKMTMTMTMTTRMRMRMRMRMMRMRRRRRRKMALATAVAMAMMIVNHSFYHCQFRHCCFDEGDDFTTMIRTMTMTKTMTMTLYDVVLVPIGPPEMN